jgi:hypothetical protein
VANNENVTPQTASDEVESADVQDDELDGISGGLEVI